MLANKVSTSSAAATRSMVPKASVQLEPISPSFVTLLPSSQMGRSSSVKVNAMVSSFQGQSVSVKKASVSSVRSSAVSRRNAVVANAKVILLLLIH